MSPSDDEIVPQFVTNYYFLDGTEPISFAVLPISWDVSSKLYAPTKCVFLHGTTDDGLQTVHKLVTSWRLGLQNDHPEIMVLLEHGKWIKLLKPRKRYEFKMRTIMITIQWLHYIKRNPEASEKSLWDHLCKIFSSFEVRPSKDDLREHFPLIKLFAQRDLTIAESQLFPMFLKEELEKRSVCGPVDEGSQNADGNEFQEGQGLFDSVCSICDNGGEILCCEGSCLRSFHATKDAGSDSYCRSLGYSRDQVEAIQNFHCKNCLYRQHQCFSCGKLGSSDKTAGAEVFQCVSATCGHFYHPKCVAELLFQENEAAAIDLRRRISAGESFTCPVHKCIVCKQGENKDIKEFQFAMCRRCPKSYHRKCLPRNIPFEDVGQGVYQRAWDGLLPNRILIYCRRHKIDDTLLTPIRNHITFPEVPEKRKPMGMQNTIIKIKLRKETHIFGNSSSELPSVEPSKMSAKISGADGSYSVAKGGKNDSMEGKTPCSVPPASSRKRVSSYPKIDGQIEEKVKTLMENVSTSIKLEDITKRCMVPSIYAYSARSIDKNITKGKIDGSVEAIRTALQKLENGVSIEDAKAVCEPGILREMVRWRKSLNVYLSPFLHGMRYTSFGRHFTKMDKLIEITDKLQLYIQDGDTVVDFCCGANDFSILMKEKLDAVGKKCSFKNYDIIQAKNNFNFEKRDWMTVQPRELPDGSRLVMGLNPPFGVKAAHANTFISKALSFQPKLLVLIVPKETQRLDQKDPPYDLIWEDPELLSGKSFYLPGSIDTEDKQIEQWNVKPPPLYLWSRSDWTEKHKEIAIRHGHIPPEYDEAWKTYRKRKKPEQNQEEFEVREEGELSDMSISPVRQDEFKRSPIQGHLPPLEANESPYKRTIHASSFGSGFDMRALNKENEMLGESHSTSRSLVHQFGHHSTGEIQQAPGDIGDRSFIGGCAANPSCNKYPGFHDTQNCGELSPDNNYTTAASSDPWLATSGVPNSIDESSNNQPHLHEAASSGSYANLSFGQTGFAPRSLRPPSSPHSSPSCGWIDD